MDIESPLGAAVPDAGGGAALPPAPVPPLEDDGADEAAAKARAHALIIAARRVQGARSRRQTGAEVLYGLCSDVRKKIRSRFRTPRFTELRKAFGEGVSAGIAKPPAVVQLARQILQAAEVHGEQVRAAGVHQSRLARMRRLVDELTGASADALRLEQERREVRGAYGLPKIRRRRRAAP